MKHSNNIDEKDLDKFLKTYSLNRFSREEADDTMVEMVFNQDYDVEINEKKEEELIDQLIPIKSNANWLWVGLFLLVFALITIFYLSYNYQKEETKKEVIEHLNNQKKIQETLLSDLEAILEVDTSMNSKSIIEIPMVIMDSTIHDTSLIEPILNQKKEIVKRIPALKTMFREDERNYYHQLKIEMINKIIEQDKKVYTEVHEGLVSYKEKKKGVDAFIVRNFSVTNMEYRAFLADLFFNKNEEALKVAIVNEHGWDEYNCKQLTASYFNTKRYDGFPVVNISSKAALLFCKWLEKETNFYLLANKPKSKPIKIRLPYDFEWISSANIGYAKTVECGGYQTIYDLNEGLINKAFSRRLERIRKHDLKKRTAYDKFYEINRYGMTEIEMLTIFKNTDTIIVDYPKGLKEIAKVGHVSEFIQSELEGIIVFGACWESKGEYIQMLNEFKKRSTSPFIGFRFIVDNGKLNTYKKPFW